MVWNVKKQFILNLFIAILAIVSAYTIYEYNTKSCFLKHRYYRYCNIDNFPWGNEGRNDDYISDQLLMVHITFRHGDRSYDTNYSKIDRLIPSLDIRCDKNSFISVDHVHKRCIDLQSWLLYLGRIKSSNKQQNTLEDLEVFPYEFENNCNSSVLTPRGLVQMFILGEYFDKKYRNYTQDGKYDIILQTTGKKRTKLSGLAFMAGILNNTYEILTAIKYVPNFYVTYIEELSGLLFNHPITGEMLDCKRLINKWDQFDRNYTPDMEFLVKYNKLLLTIKQSYELDLHLLGDIQLISKLMDRLYTLNCHHRTDIKNLLSPKLSDTFQLELIKFMDEYVAIKHKYMDPIVETRIIMLNFFRNADLIISFYNNDNNVNPTNKHLPIYIDSAHDSTILPMIMTLQLSDQYNYWPFFASRIVFELWKSSQSNSTHFIRILYNGNDISCESKLCSQSCLQNNDRCRFDDFKNSYFVGRTYNELLNDFVDNHC